MQKYSHFELNRLRSRKPNHPNEALSRLYRFLSISDVAARWGLDGCKKGYKMAWKAACEEVLKRMNLASGPSPWRPVGSSFFRDSSNLSDNVLPPSPIVLNNSPAASPANFFSSFKSVNQPLQIAPTLPNFDNEVWYPVEFQENSSYYFGTNMLDSVSNSTRNNTYGPEETLNGGNPPVQLATMIIIAFFLGLIILATVIGELFLFFLFSNWQRLPTFTNDIN